MRLLFTAPPGAGHLFPLFPLAWAALSSGHAVAMATTGANVDLAARSGVPVVDIAPDVDVATEYDRLNRETNLGGVTDPATARRRGGVRFAAMADLMLDGLVRHIERWRPDVVLYDPYQVAGLVAAHLAGIPAVLHGTGLPMRTFRPALDAMTRPRQYGLAEPPTDPAAMLNVCPDSVDWQRRHRGWPMRYVPNDLAGPLPRWLAARPSRPRICVTFGSILADLGSTALRSTVDALAEMTVEVVLSKGGANGYEIGALPPNVRVADWLPLSVVLPACSAVVHHGGAGTTFGALASGVPQVILPHGGDQPVNARAVVERGVAIMVESESAEPATIGEAVRLLLGRSSHRATAAEVARENAARPSPSDALARIAELP
ncbi:MAG TPA: glycosyltransferase [Amycolatopsis sp.]|uniref:glycosyltransferase n=1 Tax=Amycolatopsis sp. TaxID=37632 RepID=UPI002B47EB7A|nr:glycosyltransferase [Amycolatopsis sp.]HKS47651.1 glycosyltransferase [Amycolatopsis sp.]